MNSVRGRVTLWVIVVLAIVLGSAALAIDRQSDRSEMEVFDDRLQRTALLSQATAADALQEEFPDTSRQLDAVLRSTGTSLRLRFGSKRWDSGSRIPAGAPRRLRLGFSTFSAQGQRYRVLATGVDRSLGKLARLEVISSLKDLDRRADDRFRRLALVFGVTLLLAGIGTFFAVDLVLRPLGRLRRTTATITAERDLDRRVPEGGLTELSALARSFNGMLERLQTAAVDRERALLATRRFAADAGHELRTPMTSIGATLSILGRPGLSDETRAELAGDAREQQQRFVSLLDGLQALARGDASPLERRPVDLAEVVDELAADLELRNPAARIELELPDGEATVWGWEPGLRMLADNLMRNAILHGGDPPLLAVSVTSSGAGHDDVVVLTVEDNGDGIPESEREAVFDPFVRGTDVRRPGSGLGLALVAQQAGHHGAKVTIEDGTRLGGARFAVRLPGGDGSGRAD